MWIHSILFVKIGDMIDRRLSQPFEFLKYLNQKAFDLIQRLTENEVSNHLGFKGAEEILRQPFLKTSTQKQCPKDKQSTIQTIIRRKKDLQYLDPVNLNFNQRIYYSKILNLMKYQIIDDMFQKNKIKIWIKIQYHYQKIILFLMIFTQNLRNSFLDFFKQQLGEQIKNSLIFRKGAVTIDKNDDDQQYRVEQERNFKYLFGCELLDCYGILDVESRKVTVFATKCRYSYKMWMVVYKNKEIKQNINQYNMLINDNYGLQVISQNVMRKIRQQIKSIKSKLYSNIIILFIVDVDLHIMNVFIQQN